MYHTTDTRPHPISHPDEEIRDHALIFEEHILHKYGKDLYTETLMFLLDRLIKGEIAKIERLKTEIQDSQEFVKRALQSIQSLTVKV